VRRIYLDRAMRSGLKILLHLDYPVHLVYEASSYFNLWKKVASADLETTGVITNKQKLRAIRTLHCNIENVL
jgi:hypothetical protein